jgi:glucose-6-phosphate isomerase
LIRGSGVGTSVAANKHRGIRAGLCHDIYSAHQGVEHDDMNVLVLGGRVIGEALARELVLAFTTATFTKRRASSDTTREGSPTRRGSMTTRIDRQTFALAADMEAAVKASLAEWQTADKVARLWRKDASVWTSSDENRWLGWLDVTAQQLAQLDSLLNFAAEIKAENFTHALLLGMGGSSLCPEVLRLTFGKIPGYPELHILDSTDPAQVRSVEKRIDFARTLFIVSSKSGGTLEPNIFKQYFYERAKALLGADEIGRRFIAITDPGSNMQRVAERDRFRRIFFGVPEIGGRYSALSAFGMVPAAVMGLDVGRFLRATDEMVRACGPTIAAADNPGVVLGTILGVLGNRGRNKVTIVTSPGIGDLGAWLEQLLAESTGKNGKGLIPVDGEPLGTPAVYGADRVFAYLRLESAPDASQDAAIDALERAGQPVVRIAVEEPYNLGEEFFRWEMATAVAGSILGINPFDQPDVEASKVATRRLTEEYERTGTLPPEQPILEDGGIRLFADAGNATALAGASGGDQSLAAYIEAHLKRLSDGDYFALLAYVDMNEAHAEPLRTMRHIVRDARVGATCVGFGPRFLHSTGQAYKGGPNTGVFLQVTCDDAADLQVPGQKYTFGIVKAAQARGDFEVLAERGRRALRVHLGPDVEPGLKRLQDSIQAAIKGR